jgi:hypothetical protein
LTRDIEILQQRMKQQESLIGHLSRDNNECGAKLQEKDFLINELMQQDLLLNQAIRTQQAEIVGLQAENETLREKRRA